MLRENGPWLVNEQLEIEENPFPWNARISMLYVDQPAGAGWSYVDDPSGYVSSTAASTEQLYDALLQFFKEHSEYTKVPFYVAGESYGGKYVPALSHKILASGGIPNFAGVLIGDGYVDAEIQTGGYGITGYFAGVFDTHQRRYFEDLQAKCLLNIVEKKWAAAFEVCWNQIVAVEYPEITGGLNIYDVRSHHAYNFSYLDVFMDQPWVRSMFRVPSNVSYHCISDILWDLFKPDFCQSERVNFEEMLSEKSNLRVLMYVGQFDFAVNSFTLDMFVEGLRWTGARAFNEKARTVWRNSKGELAGWRKKSSGGKFQYVVVADAGHMSPMDQPGNIQEMVEEFVLGHLTEGKEKKKV